MLNEAKDYNEDTASFGEDTSVYSLVSEANESNTHNDDGDKSKYSSSDDSVEMENGNGLNLGLLIIEGAEEEEDDDETKEEEEYDASKRSMKSTSVLSVPETVFLPSEIRSIAAVSCVTHANPYEGINPLEQDKNKPNESKDGNQIIGNFLCKWSQLLPCVSRWRDGLGACSFNAMHLIPALMILMTLVSLSSWRSHEWKNEALRLREELQKQKALLPITLSLLKERESLVKKQKLLEQVMEGVKADDDALLSFKNCYVEASLSLGRCSNEWQRWWSDTSDSSSAHHGTEKETSNDYSSYDYDGGFTDDMSKLVKSFSNSLASTTAQSYSFIEKNLKYMSYDGIKDAFSGDNYIQSTVKSTPETASNDTGGRDSFNRALSKLWNDLGVTADEVAEAEVNVDYS
mmetsp:Transcript_38473/g.69344  ORF Transcript_38473/g.69344 Transcript_38473/m.69344 type:complete len:403 (+) Transcript_38473:163-1371(+)|eukprot:CAMPEP_0201870136 /NCGR_PEP_ID=MMETSP0902-20130614/3360_1 /ASSEMBLY_ACC=CAM_ASM_000551 /TAXON_ID=420261 /ORGANISM="Thalassiosira antarctica, Strain CCMP982" /LENGTH=402 /DNA_ID=CAMNT_0048395711 /DNA_START=126 /DNA_END=1334 /DNA_ORIENTATION=-